MRLINGEEAPAEFQAMLSLGNKVKLDLGDDNPNTAIYHILAIVDNDQIVYKVWRKDNRQWYYKVDNAYLLYLYWSDGVLRRVY